MKKLALLFLLLSSSSFACELDGISVHASEGFDSSYKIEVGGPTTSEVTQASFYEFFIGPISLYAQDIYNKYPELKFNLQWENPYMTAYANVRPDSVTIGMFGGMARIDGLKNDTIALIACHEVGHVLGGAPYINIEGYGETSSEGQADYYATNVCLKRYFKFRNDTPSEVLSSDADRFGEFCDESDDYPICVRTMKAVENFQLILKKMKPTDSNIEISKQDTTEVDETLYNAYPSNQCRIDTMIAGLSNFERPSCWFVK